MLESLGAQLKQKEGELAQLQLLLGEQARLRENMNREMTRLTIQAEQVEDRKEDLGLCLTFICLADGTNEGGDRIFKRSTE